MNRKHVVPAFGGHFVALPTFRRPKSEKKDDKEAPSASGNPISTKSKKKGFLPETKKRKKRNAERVTPENATPAASNGDQAPGPGKKRKRKRKNKTKAEDPAKSLVNGVPDTQSPVPALPIMNPRAPAKTPKQPKKKQKLSHVNGGSALPPTEPANEKQQQQEQQQKKIKNNLPANEVLSSKSPNSSQTQKRAKLSLVSRSTSLPKKGAKKKAQPRKNQS